MLLYLYCNGLGDGSGEKKYPELTWTDDVNRWKGWDVILRCNIILYIRIRL